MNYCLNIKTEKKRYNFQMRFKNEMNFFFLKFQLPLRTDNAKINQLKIIRDFIEHRQIEIFQRTVFNILRFFFFLSFVSNRS